MTIGSNALLWGSIIWLPWLMYALLCDEAKPKKNIILGATIPYAAREDAEVLQIIAVFKKEMLLTAILLMLPAAPCIFIRSLGISMTLWLIWVVLVCFAFYIPYGRANIALKRLKEKRGWKRSAEPVTFADLKAVSAEQRWLSPLAFLPPFLISLIPMAVDWEMWLLWVINAACVVFFYLTYRFCYRNRAEMVDSNTDLTIALTRIRRYNWGKAWLMMAWAMAVLSFALCFTMDHVWWMTAVLLVFTLAVISIMLRIEFRVRHMQQSLCVNSGQGDYLDEDDHWILGMFYHNPNDSRTLVNARVGMNSTFNLATRAGQILTGMTLLILLACPLIGVWLTGMEQSSVELTVTETTVEATFIAKDYTVALDEIERAVLLDTLPKMRRVAGTGMPSVSTGTWSSSEWGRFTCCIDPREGPWLLLETEGGRIYLFGGGEATESVYQSIIP